MSSRAGIVVTGTEILTGRVSDRNGPWLAEQLRVAGVDIAQVVVVGDRPEELAWALRALAAEGLDLLITSGGLGPTADDLTAEIVGAVQGRPSELVPELEQRIADIVARLSTGRGWRLDPQATARSVRKQAMVPVGATVLDPVGTAPGLVVPVADGRSGPPVVVLPGPPGELQGMWPAALADDLVRAALSGRQELRQETIRLWDIPESEIAATLRGLAETLDGLEITTCQHGGELEIVSRFAPDAQSAYESLVKAVEDYHSANLFSTDGQRIDDIVADLLRANQLTIATAESCTAGLLAARLTDLAGSSAYMIGGLVVYSNQAKHDLAGVPLDVIDRVGAVSAEVALALANGVRERLGTDLGVGITGIAGPGGASAEKPVGLVYLCVASGNDIVSQRIEVPGSRQLVRQRSTAVALHMIRRMLTCGQLNSA